MANLGHDLGRGIPPLAFFIESAIFGAMKFSMVSALLFAGALGATAAQDAAALAEKVAAAYGGAAALEKLVAFREEGTVESTMRPGTSATVRVFARALKLRVEINRTSQPSELRVVNEAKGWRDGKEVTGMSYEAMVLQAVRLDLAWQLFAHKTNLVEAAPLDRHGHHLRVLELTIEDGLKVTAGIDPENGHILFSSGTTKAAATGATTFETEYDDFKTVDGLLFAHKETNFAQGTKPADTTLSKVELLKTAPPEAFKPGLASSAPPERSADVPGHRQPK